MFSPWKDVVVATDWLRSGPATVDIVHKTLATEHYHKTKRSSTKNVHLKADVTYCRMLSPFNNFFVCSYMSV